MDVVADSPTMTGLQECLGSMLASFERSVGFAEGVVMSFDPDVLLPNAFAASVERGLDDAVLACRNEQLDHDFLKFRDLAASRTPVGVASRDSDPARSSPRWREILEVRGHGHELRAALLDAQAYPGFARALLAGLAMRAGADAGPDIAVRVRAADGRWVRARAERITSAAGRPQGLVVMIDAARPGYVLPLAARAYRLTGREVEVVRSVLNGLDTRSVAASLHISEYTVQDHLKSVFDKTGVRSRRELAHQFAVGLG